MFSALTSDIKKACRETHVHGVYEPIWHTSWEVTKKTSTLETCVLSVSHRKLVDSSGVLQQLLKRDGPAQHAAGRAGLSARSPWKAGAAAATAPCKHVQLYNASRDTNTPIYQPRKAWPKNETEPDLFVCRAQTCFQFAEKRDGHVGLFMLTSVWHSLALWIERWDKR